MTKLVVAGLIIASSLCSLISCSAPTSIKVSPTNISFTSAGTDNSPSKQILRISSTGSGALTWKLTSSAPWLYVSPSNGTSVDVPESIDVSINMTGMEAGDYSAVIIVDAPQAMNSPQTIPVTLSIGPKKQLTLDPSYTSGVQLLAPTNGYAGLKVRPASFSWNPWPGATRYQCDIAADSEFKSLVVTATTTTTGYAYSGTLNYSTTYFWRVKALEVIGPNGPGDWSATFFFITAPGPATP